MRMDASNTKTPPQDRQAYGGFWIRFAATAVDTVVLLIPILLVSFLYRSTTPPANSELEKVVVDLVDIGLNFTIWWVYTAVLLSSSWQATIGKKVCGLRVVDYDGRRVTFGRATGRYFASFLSAVLLCVGFFMIAWTRRKQGLHDFMANTLVIKNVSYAKFYDDIKTQESGLALKRAESCLGCKFSESSEKSDLRILFCTVKSVGVTKDYYCSSWESK